MFETFIVQPIFNLLLILYAVVGDFGLAIIIFTVLIRLAMWPLLKRQLHQTKKMRELQPEIKKIRKKYKGGDRQAESAALMELYKQHEVNPMGSMGLLLIQLPVFLGLFAALRSLIDSPERLLRLPYSFIQDNETVQQIFQTIADKTNVAIEAFKSAGGSSELVDSLGSPVTSDALRMLSKDEMIELYNNVLVADVEGSSEALVQGPYFVQELFGVIDLSTRAISDAGVYWPVMIIAILAGVFQYLQTKQLAPAEDKKDSSKSIGQMMKESSKSGEQPDQSEVSAALSKRMGLFFAPLIIFISATSPPGLALYFATSGLVGLIQQRIILKGDVKEMEEIADEAEEENKTTKANKPKKKNKGTKSSRAARKKRKR